MENLTYRQISFDTADIAPGHPVKATFFEAAPYAYVNGSTRVTEFDEKTIVRWLMLCPPSRHIILEELGPAGNCLLSARGRAAVLFAGRRRPST